VLVGAAIPDELPATVYDAFFEDSHWKLHPPLTGKVDNQNSPASLERITTSIRNKLRYLQGAPSVAMQEIPPDIQGLLWDEERNAEEKDEERGTGRAGEQRSDSSSARNEFFDGENDVDCDDDFTPSSSRGKAGSGTVNRKPRSSRRGRGRGRGRTASTPTTVREEGEEDIAEESAPSSRRGRGRGRGNRGRGRSKTNDKEKDKENSNPVADSSSTPLHVEEGT